MLPGSGLGPLLSPSLFFGEGLLDGLLDGLFDGLLDGLFDGLFDGLLDGLFIMPSGVYTIK